MKLSGRTLNLASILPQIAGLLLVLVTISSPAIAGDNGNDHVRGDGKGDGRGHDKGDGRGDGRPSYQSAPELDLGSLSGAVTLLVGGTLVITDRLRKK